MGLLNDVKKENAAKAKAPAEANVAPTTEGNVGAPVETKKKHNNSEYQKRQREKALASANILKALIEEKKIELNAEQQEALDFLCRVKKPREGGVGAGPSIFEKLFGAEPKVGTVIGAYDMLKKTGKGFADMNKLIKKWAEEDSKRPFTATVEFNEEKLEYTLKAYTKK